MSHIDRLIKHRTEDLSFITLGAETELNLSGYQLPEAGLDVPLLTTELAENIKNKAEDEVLTVAAIMRGMLYTLGVDPNFTHREQYVDFLKAADSALDQFIVMQALKEAEGERWLEAALYLKGGILALPQNPQLKLQYALTLMKYSGENPRLKANTVKAFHQEVIHMLEQISDEMDHPLIYYHLAFLYKEEKQYVRAQVYAQRFMDSEPEEEAALQTTYLLRELENLAAYERGYEAVLAGKPAQGLELLLPLENQFEDWWNLHFFIGLAYQQLSQYKKAIPYFERVLTMKPDQVDALLEIGLAHSSLGEVQAAEEYYIKLLEIEGDNPEILCIAGAFYSQIKDYKQAETCFRRGLKLDPKNQTILGYLEALQQGGML